MIYLNYEKNSITFIFTFQFFSLFTENRENNTKKCIPKKGYYLKLKSVFDDSRCSEGVTCVWAGEVSVIIEVYRDKQLIEEKRLTLNSKNKEENIKWLVNYLPESSRNIKWITVLPYPKEGIVVKPKKQFISITYND